MRGLRRTIAYYEDLDIPVNPSSHKQLRINCPFCYDKERDSGVKTPKPDRHKSLALNTETLKGYCHRCDTVIISHKDEGKLNLGLENDEEENAINPKFLPDIDITKIPMAYENEKAMEYLKNRNIVFTPNIVKKLDFRYIETGKVVNDILEGPKQIKLLGILAPLKYNGRVKSYQIRYITNNKKFRFHTMEGKKLLYSAKPLPVFNEITICEGVYDAIACMAMGFPNVTALLGKTPSKLQMEQLKEIAPYKVNLCLDEPDLNYTLLRVLRRGIKTLERYKSWKFKGYKDPEEFYKANKDFRFNTDKKLELKL